MKLSYLQTHPIQYNAPFFSKLTNSVINLEVIFFSKEGMNESLDVQFNTTFKWDIPLLDNYNYSFINNNSFKPSIHNGFLGLLNMGIIKKLKNTPPSIVVVPGWHYASYIIAIIAAKFFGHKLVLRGESPLSQELLKSKLILSFRKILFKYFLFKILDHAFYIGEQNKSFYVHYGLKENKLLFVPYSVDNERFQNYNKSFINERGIFKKKLGIKTGTKIILFSGKYISKKRPLDLLMAFHYSNISNSILVLMGEGELRQELEKYILENNLNDKVILTGFINQTLISNYYSIADIFVMCSGPGETWGLSVNEAMNFGLKIIVSDITGCGDDLVRLGKTGWIFPYGNVTELTNKINIALLDTEIKKFDIIDQINIYSYLTCVNSIKSILN